MKTEKAARRPGVEHWIAIVRTAIYSVVATVYFVAMTTVFAWVMLFPPERMRWAINGWAIGDLWLLRVICGQRYEVLGRENMPHGPAVVASKHQSAWETIAFLPLVPRSVIILKKELLRIPLYGNYARFYGMISVDREAGPSALKQLAKDAATRLDSGGQLVIFPEGTRRPVNGPPDYKPGAIFLYDQLKVPMVPVALNSGVFWPRGRFVRYPGCVQISFLPPIPPGKPRAEAKALLIERVETESARLAALATQ